MKTVTAGLILMALVARAWAMEPVPAPAAPVKSVPATAPGKSDAAAKAAAAVEPAVRTSTAAAPGTAQDRIELDATQITGNRELPRVLYVVPWKRPDLGELAGKPANSLLDEVLAPVDRDVFRRQNRYYEALKPDSAAPGTGNRTEGEK